jgi:hypothetical protein
VRRGRETSSLVAVGTRVVSPRRGGTEADFAELLKWEEAYWDRQTPTSFNGHQRLFETFGAAKFRIQGRKEANHLLADLNGPHEAKLR